jgi:hypothetical protein
MTREQAKELWPIVKAFSEGRQVQWRAASGIWMGFNPCRDSLDIDCDWRIKPEPRACSGRGSTRTARLATGYAAKPDADHLAKLSGTTPLRFVEEL